MKIGLLRKNLQIMMVIAMARPYSALDIRIYLVLTRKKSGKYGFSINVQEVGIGVEVSPQRPFGGSVVYLLKVRMMMQINVWVA